MLNEYHLQFLHNFTDHGVRFLIIGGQARHVHNGSVTRDLDPWVAIDPASTPSLERALVRWSQVAPGERQHFRREHGCRSARRTARRSRRARRLAGSIPADHRYSADEVRVRPPRTRNRLHAAESSSENGVSTCSKSSESTGRRWWVFFGTAARYPWRRPLPSTSLPTNCVTLPLAQNYTTEPGHAGRSV